MLKACGVNKFYSSGGWFGGERRQVLSNIEMEWEKGESLGVIGESGSGKSTLGRLLLGIEPPDSGTVTFDGLPVSGRRRRKGGLSAVFQDYTSSINPFYTVEKALLEPLELLNEPPATRGTKIRFLLRQVGLDESFLPKYPHELSGGQAQRVCLARAISTEPACILLDEAISSLDGSVQMQILELLSRLRRESGTGYIFITHDIQAAAYLCDRLLIVLNGQIIETIATQQLREVQTSYARELLAKTWL
ncbi:ATP-binding cassette domain-containing protein [Cohnella sp. LGH]|uniref:ABC transporter ATP-binding protein n=1 Tax=unclassified Cohnella TaxID=2636738 RepID=UPI001ADD57D6|nr:ATP-binding cassette domain-containing protein [Cohnella sp. LGH]QTH46574.1 ATP-binding cassette domain-containing protein [Cohnella sp. LGH]